jgi:predicted acylesterase/phospholipase RssA
MNKLKHLGFSGAGFAIPGIAGAGYELLKSGYNPDIISGVSSGAILTFIICASKNRLETIKNNAIGFKSTQVFKHPPFNKNGKITIRSIWNAITKNYLSKQDRLDDFLRSVVSKQDWEDYINDENSITGVIMSVDLLSGSRIFHKLKEMTYEDAILAVVSSTSIPVFANSVEYKDYLLVDGGVRNHILTDWILDNYDIEQTINVFARPQDFKKITTKEKLSNTYKILERTVEIMQFEISKNDEQLAELKCIKRGIKYNNIYIKNILKNVYDVDIKKQEELFNTGIEEAKKISF